MASGSGARIAWRCSRNGTATRGATPAPALSRPVRGRGEVDEGKVKRAVLFVHGVGEQHKSGSLLWMGSSVVDWVLRWCATFYPDRSEERRVGKGVSRGGGRVST